jgi:pimeloyl-ACP methyl ester carboxylesterase
MPITANLYYTVNRQESGQYPVLLIHGAGGTHLHWPPEVRRLPGQPVFALDLPGHGKSTGLGQQSIPAYAGAILSWLDAMQINQAIFVGHSMGGAISQYLGLKNPDRTAGLGLVGTGARLRVLPSILDNSANSLTFPSAVAEITSCSYAPRQTPAWSNWLQPGCWKFAHPFCTVIFWHATSLILCKKLAKSPRLP